MRANYKTYITIIVVTLALTSCAQKQKADLIIKNATVYTVNDSFDISTSFAVKDGSFIAIGNDQEISDLYEANDIIEKARKKLKRRLANIFPDLM